MTLATPISRSAQKYFLQDVKGKLCSKFGEHRSKTDIVLLFTTHLQDATTVELAINDAQLKN